MLGSTQNTSRPVWCLDLHRIHPDQCDVWLYTEYTQTSVMLGSTQNTSRPVWYLVVHSIHPDQCDVRFYTEYTQTSVMFDSPPFNVVPSILADCFGWYLHSDSYIFPPWPDRYIALYSISHKSCYYYYNKGSPPSAIDDLSWLGYQSFDGSSYYVDVDVDV